jgi:hypothetical protein
VPLPRAGLVVTTVSIRVATAHFLLEAGAPDLLSGTVEYNVAELAPIVTSERGLVKVQQGKIEGIGILPPGAKNDWAIYLNGTIPLRLTIEAGAYEATMNLSGLRLQRLEINQGAATASIAWTTPSTELLQEVIIQTGASRTTVQGLGHANPSSLRFQGGVGSYLLDFSGSLRRPLMATVRTGASDLTIAIPATTPAQVTLRGGLTSTNLEGDWRQNGSVFTNAAWGKGPNTLTLTIETGMGNLTLRTLP